MEKTENFLKFKAICLGKEKGKVEYKEVTYDLLNLPKNSVVIKMSYSAIGPYDINTMNGIVKVEEKSISFGFEGSGVISHVGADIDKSFIGKKVGFMTVNSEVKAYSEYSIVPFNNIVVFKDEIANNPDLFKQGAYVFGNPFTAKGFFIEVIDKGEYKSIIMDTANSSLGKMMAKLCLKKGIKLITITRSEEGVKTMNQISKDFINLNSSDNAFNDSLKEAISKNHPNLYVTFQGGNFPSRVFEAMERLSTMAILGNITNENINGFTSVTFIFMEKKMFGYSVMEYFQDLQKINKFTEVAEEVLSDSCYKTEFNSYVVEFKLSEFNKGIEYYSKNSGKGKILFVPEDHK